MSEERNDYRDRGDRGDRGGDRSDDDRGGRGGSRGGGPRGRRGPGGPGGRRWGRRKVCRFRAEKVRYIDWKDYKMLRQFVSDSGKIIPRRTTGTSAKYQVQLTEAIKRARYMALLPVSASHKDF